MDPRLVEAAKSGDREAFEAIAMGVADRLYAIARLILRDSHLAQDAVQETLVHAWRHLPGLRDPQRMEAWLHRLVVNACADQGRQQRRWSTDLRVIAPDTAEDDGARLADRDLIERGFRKLNPDQRTVVVLRYYVDLTVPEIARTLGVAEGTVKSRLHHSLLVLRASLDADQQDSRASMERLA